MPKGSVDASTQTNNVFSAQIKNHIQSSIDIQKISDIMALYKDLVPEYNSLHKRCLSIVIYFLLRLKNISYEETGKVLSILHLNSIQNCAEWAKVISEEDDVCVILRENRGRLILLYCFIYEIKISINLFVRFKRFL